jgi:hypothetical protein
MPRHKSTPPTTNVGSSKELVDNQYPTLSGKHSTGTKKRYERRALHMRILRRRLDPGYGPGCYVHNFRVRFNIRRYPPAESVVPSELNAENHEHCSST